MYYILWYDYPDKPEKPYIVYDILVYLVWYKLFILLLSLHIFPAAKCDVPFGRVASAAPGPAAASAHPDQRRCNMRSLQPRRSPRSDMAWADRIFVDFFVIFMWLAWCFFSFLDAVRYIEICWDVWMAYTQWDNIADSKKATVSVCTTTCTSCTGCMTESASGSAPRIDRGSFHDHHHWRSIILRHFANSYVKDLHPMFEHLCQRKDM